jgi:N,N'-diacetyllegionaminate synthase
MEMKIGNITIGDGHPCLVIPEAGDNHRGSLERAKELAYAAKEAGAKIIKFQLHLPDEEMDREGMKKTSSDMFQKWGDLYGFISTNLLSVENHAKLIEYCKEIDIQYFCTPFSSKAAQILTEIGGASAFKIGSGETEDLPMIENVAAYGRPMIISTGMSDYDEIALTAETMKQSGTPFAFAHCISTYPPKSISDLHMGVIRSLREKHGVLTGFSDHTPPEGITSEDGVSMTEAELMAMVVAQGGCFVEKHFTIDRNAPDADSHFSHDTVTLKRLIQDIERLEKATDAKREVFENEKGVWIWAKRSLFVVADLSEGTVLSREMMCSKRPGIGIRSKDYKSIMGKKLKRSLHAGEMIALEDLE